MWKSLFWWWKNKNIKQYTLVDLNAGMIKAVTDPSPGFQSKLQFWEPRVEDRLRSIPWFQNCGNPFPDLDLTNPMKQVGSWQEALEFCKEKNWSQTELDAQNQLTVWLFAHDRERYQNWNALAGNFKDQVITPLCRNHIIPFQQNHGLDIAFVHSVEWDILSALMEEAYLPSGHQVFFFLELLMVYEAGHFPCGWKGNWPEGTLVVY